MAIQLRDVRSEDKEQLRNWRNKPTVASYMYTDNYITEEEHGRWFRNVMTDRKRRYWIIVSEGLDIGLANLYDIDQHNQRCYWAFYIAEDDQRGKGIGGFIEYLVLSYVFDELRLNRLCCEVIASNVSVLNLHKSFGFKEEGFLRQHIFKDGKPMDIYCLAILREEWEKVKQEVKERLHKIDFRRVRSPHDETGTI